MKRGYFIIVLCVIFLAGCASTGKNRAMDLQQCQSRVERLEQEMRERDREITTLTFDLKRKSAESYQQSATKVKTNSGSTDFSKPSALQIQKALKKAGYYNGPVDGKIGAKTQDAIVKFQKDNGLKADGKVGQMTWAELSPYLE